MVPLGTSLLMPSLAWCLTSNVDSVGGTAMPGVQEAKGPEEAMDQPRS